MIFPYSGKKEKKWQAALLRKQNTDWLCCLQPVSSSELEAESRSVSLTRRGKMSLVPTQGTSHGCWQKGYCRSFLLLKRSQTSSDNKHLWPEHLFQALPLHQPQHLPSTTSDRDSAPHSLAHTAAHRSALQGVTYFTLLSLFHLNIFIWEREKKKVSDPSLLFPFLLSGLDSVFIAKLLA